MTASQRRVNQTPIMGLRAGAVSFRGKAVETKGALPSSLCFANHGLLKPVYADVHTRRGFKLTMSTKRINFDGDKLRIGAAIAICDLGGFGLLIDGAQVIGPAPHQAMAVSSRILARAECAVQALFRSNRAPTADEIVWASGDALIGTTHLADLIVYGRVALEVSSPLSEISRVYPIDAGFEWQMQRRAPRPQPAALCCEPNIETGR